MSEIFDRKNNNDKRIRSYNDWWIQLYDIFGQGKVDDEHEIFQLFCLNHDYLTQIESKTSTKFYPLSFQTPLG